MNKWLKSSKSFLSCFQDTQSDYLQSLLWCLYGKLIADIDETLKKEIANSGGYNAFLIKNLNITARQQVEEIKKEDVQRIKRNGYAPSDKKLKENAIYSVSIHFGDVAIPSIPCKTFTVIRSYDFIKAEEKGIIIRKTAVRYMRGRAKTFVR